MSPPKLKPSKDPKSLDAEIRSNVLKIAELEEAQRANRTFGERLSEVISNFCGSMTFVWIHVGWFGGWIVINAATRFQFDPFPFTFLTLVVSLEAIFLSTFILIAQNQETRMTERRNHLDLQINMLAEKEDTTALELLQAIAEKVGIPHDHAAIKALTEPVEPADLVEKIVEARGENVEEVLVNK